MKLKSLIKLAILSHINNVDLTEEKRLKLAKRFNLLNRDSDVRLRKIDDGRWLLSHILVRTLDQDKWLPHWEVTLCADHEGMDRYVPNAKLEEFATFCHGSSRWWLKARNEFVIINDLTYHRHYGNVHEWSDGSFRTYREHGGEEEISRYHGSARSWRNKDSVDKLYGVEVEMNARKGTHRGHLAAIAKAHGFLAEHDSSLDSVRGVEIIAPPYSFEGTVKDDGPWMKFLEAINGKADGFRAGNDYGMHVSINRLHMSRLHSAKLVVFIHNNQSMCEIVAGRRGNQWQQYRQKTFGAASVGEGEKKEAIAIRSYSRLEMRIFRSQVNPECFKRNIEFVDSCLEFSRNASVKQLTEGNYKDYLKKNRNTYPRIADLLCGKVEKKSKYAKSRPEPEPA